MFNCISSKQLLKIGAVLRNWLRCHTTNHWMQPVHGSCGHKLFYTRRPKLFLKGFCLKLTLFFLFSLSSRYPTTVFMLTFKFIASASIALTDLQNMCSCSWAREWWYYIYVRRKSGSERHPKCTATRGILRSAVSEHWATEYDVTTCFQWYFLMAMSWVWSPNPKVVIQLLN